MKLISLVLCFLSFAAFADETCRTSQYHFKITNSYIAGYGHRGNIRMAYDEVRSISRRSRQDFLALLSSLSDEKSTDEVLSVTEKAALERFSLTLADQRESLFSIMYLKGYDKSGILMLRYMVVAGQAYRCQ